jgi:hypothetical protein
LHTLVHRLSVGHIASFTGRTMSSMPSTQLLHFIGIERLAVSHKEHHRTSALVLAIRARIADAFHTVMPGLSFIPAG